MNTAAAIAGGPRAGVAGWPIAHSRSPIIHGYWLAKHGLAGSYERVPVAPDEAEAFFANLARGDFAGLNVTVPHKELAARACDALEPVAAALGAANTLWVENGRLYGTNTDVEGFLANLDEGAPGWDANPGPAIVLGAGGAARAVIHGLASRGFAPIAIVNRTLDRAALLTGLAPVASAHGYDDLPKLLEMARLVVNTTSLGMKGSPPLDIDLAPLDPAALVTDIVYVPLETPLLAMARARGNPVVDGLGMLLHQAVPGFERWFGVRPKVDAALRAEVLATFA